MGKPTTDSGFTRKRFYSKGSDNSSLSPIGTRAYSTKVPSRDMFARCPIAELTDIVLSSVTAWRSRSKTPLLALHASTPAFPPARWRWGGATALLGPATPVHSSSKVRRLTRLTHFPGDVPSPCPPDIADQVTTMSSPTLRPGWRHYETEPGPNGEIAYPSHR